MDQNCAPTDSILINEVQLLLAEKRTSLAVLRTGIAIFAIPLSVLSVLIATSKYYDFFHVLNFLIPLLILNMFLVVLGFYLIIRSLRRMKHHDHLMAEIKKNNSAIAEFID
jgi:uncharacterized membrane protein YidH (DUF202 family)